MNQLLKVNTPKVVFERIDEEVVLINMESGSYYSLTETGAVIWEMIENGIGTEAMLTELLIQYDAPVTVIEPALATFISELEKENLVIGVDSVIDIKPLENEKAIGTKQPFGAPILNRYNDMQELLLLDPIHDVDESGWPNIQQ